MTAKLNGQPVSLETATLHWSSLRRKWKSGRSVDDRSADAALGEPLRCRKAYPAAILYGPVVLGGTWHEADLFVNKIDLEHLDRDLSPSWATY